MNETPSGNMKRCYEKITVEDRKLELKNETNSIAAPAARSSTAALQWATGRRLALQMIGLTETRSTAHDPGPSNNSRLEIMCGPRTQYRLCQATDCLLIAVSKVSLCTQPST